MTMNPDTGAATSRGLLDPAFFQMAYVTNGIERACTVLQQRYGIREFSRIEGEPPGGGIIRMALAWTGATMIEVIEADGPECGFYNERLRPGAFDLRHHHLGFFVEDDGEWDAMRATAAEQGLAVMSERDDPGMFRSCYVEAPELNHYLEYIQLREAGRAFFQGIARN